MKTINRQKHVPTTSYHQNDFLLLQFILSDFIEVFGQVKILHTQTQELAKLFSKRGTNESKELVLHDLIKTTEYLSGASFNNMRIFTWGQEGGLLNKLNHYCALFSRQALEKLKEAQKIYAHVNQSWLTCIQLHDILLRLKDLAPRKWKDHVELIVSLEKKIHSKMQKFSKLLPVIIKEYAYNENVIYFILQHHVTFDELFHKGYVKSLFKKIYDGELQEAETRLLKCYQKRGFNQLLPIITNNMQELQG